jgi:hypothetical protein
MDEEKKFILTRETLVLAGFFSSWFVSVLLLIALVKNFSREFLHNLTFYFILLYCFYIFDRIAIWAVERYFFRGKGRERRLFDSVAVIFVVASAIGYFVLLYWYCLVLPTKVG